MAVARASAAESQAFRIDTDQWPEYDGYMHFAEGEIRVIDIKAGNPPICRLRHVSLGKKPPYHALSYYLGAPVEPENLKTVELNGSRIFIRPNIYAFLWHLIPRYQEATV